MWAQVLFCILCLYVCPLLFNKRTETASHCCQCLVDSSHPSPTVFEKHKNEMVLIFKGNLIFITVLHADFYVKGMYFLMCKIWNVCQNDKFDKVFIVNTKVSMG